MIIPSTAATTAPTPAEELAAVLAQVAVMTKLSVDITKMSIDLHQRIPVLVARSAAAAAAAAPPPAPAVAAPLFIEGVARTPAQLEAAFPPGHGDKLPWYVVCIGREPGLYATSDESERQVNGIPRQFRIRKGSRVEALNFYRERYEEQAVSKINEAPPAPATAAAPGGPGAPGASASNTRCA
ncbi:hypothetical protein C8R43DRAFT_945014 [Mycena crocata]|nr:hypothetical protein C8R43DRAFT_958739 [Mycena crocata]KAJ7169042.1 hypothetical protein C8R43DRAFT_945014 [Mycena crocata]